MNIIHLLGLFMHCYLWILSIYLHCFMQHCYLWILSILGALLHKDSFQAPQINASVRHYMTLINDGGDIQWKQVCMQCPKNAAFFMRACVVRACMCVWTYMYARVFCALVWCVHVCVCVLVRVQLCGRLEHFFIIAVAVACLACVCLACVCLACVCCDVRYAVGFPFLRFF